MPRNGFLRRGSVAVLAGAAMALTAAPASAALPVAQLPCLPGISCDENQQPLCDNAAVEPAKGNLAAVRRATLCLLNHERAERGLGKLRQNRALRGVAAKYAKSMVNLHFFDHVSPQGSTFTDRIKRSPYLRDANGYSLGENLAWGAGLLATPERIVKSWMASPGHRANILNGSFKDIGIGIAPGVPILSGASGATYVNEFGARGR